jgi:hypothetical protein
MEHECLNRAVSNCIEHECWSREQCRNQHYHYNKRITAKKWVESDHSLMALHEVGIRCSTFMCAGGTGRMLGQLVASSFDM